MPRHFRRYYQYVEKDTAKISVIWKVLHIFVFVLIVIDSFCIAVSFHDIYRTFSYNCLLYADPYLSTVVVQWKPHTTTTVAPSILPLKTLDLDEDPEENTTHLEDVTDAQDETTTKTVLPKQTTTIVTTTTAMPETTAKVEISDERYYVVNATTKSEVILDYRKTRFGNKATCDAMLFFPLSALVLSSFAMVMVTICGKGGRGYKSDILTQSWSYVYPILIFSVIMLITNGVLLTLLERGMNKFCYGFRQYTGEETCTYKMNYFTGYVGRGEKDFFEFYLICHWASYIGVLLWTAQGAWTLLRIIYVADFSLIMITVSSARRSSLLGQDPVHAALMDSFQGLAKVSHFIEHQYDPEDRPEEESEEIRSRRSKRIEKGKKKVVFADDPNISEDEERGARHRQDKESK